MMEVDIKQPSDDEILYFIIHSVDFILRNSRWEYNHAHLKAITKLCKETGIDEKDPDYTFKFNVMALFSILTLNGGKTNVITFIGKPNCGKSLFTNVLCAGLKTGAAHSMNSRSNFWLQDLIDKDIYIFEEFTVDVFNAEYFKALLEGSMHVMVEKKNQHAVHLQRRPLITTGNFVPWQMVSSMAPAYKSRAIIIMANQEIPYAINADPNRRPDLLLECKKQLFNVIVNK